MAIGFTNAFKMCVCVCILGTPESDTVCEKCPQGFFSSVTSAAEPCQPHKDCSQLGLKTLRPGTATHDVQCESQHTFDCSHQHAECHNGERCLSPDTHLRGLERVCNS